MRAAAPLILMLVLVLVACAAPVSGTIVDKDYDPPRQVANTGTERYSCGTETYRAWTGAGKSRYTTTRTRTKWCERPKTGYRTTPADWDLTVRDDSGTEHEVEVSQAEYDRASIGQRWDG